MTIIFVKNAKSNLMKVVHFVNNNNANNALKASLIMKQKNVFQIVQVDII